MRRQRTSFLIALESEEVVATPVAEVPVPTIPELTEMELPEIEANASDFDAFNIEVAETEEVVTALESLQEVLRGSLATEGLSRTSAGLLDVTLDRLYARVGMSKPAIPALESGTSLTNIQKAQAALESIGESVKKIIAAIIAAIKKAIAWVKSHFEKIFGAAALMERAAKKLVADAASAKDVLHQAPTCTAGSLLKHFEIAGKVTQDLRGDASHLANMAEIVLVKMQHEAYDTAEGVVLAVQKLSAADLQTAMTKLTKRVDGFREVTPVHDYETADDSVEFKSAQSKEMLGSVVIEQNYVTTPAGAVAHVRSCEAYLQTTVPVTHAPSGDVSIAWLTPSEVGHVATAVADIAKAIQNFKADLYKAVRLEEQCVAAMGNVGDKNARTDVTDSTKETTSTSQNAFWQVTRELPRLLTSLSAEFSQHGLVVGRAMLTFCDMSLHGA